MGEELGAAVDEGDAAPEAAEHLAELDADVAAAEDQEVIGDLVELHEGGVRVVRDVAEAVDRWDGGARADVDDDGGGGQVALPAVVEVDADLVGCGEAGGAHEEVERLDLPEAGLGAVTERFHDVAFALAHAFQVDGDAAVAGADAVFCGAPCDVGDAGAGDHGLGRGATLVDAGTAGVLALDEGDALPGLGEFAGEGAAALAGPDDDGVVTVAHGCLRLRAWGTS